MISSEAVLYIARGLRSAGFEPMIEYVDDIGAKSPAVCEDIYPAFIRVSSAELSEYRVMEVPGGRAFVSIKIRALGAKKGFSDAAELRKRGEEALSGIYLGSSMIIQKASCGEISRDMSLGRLVMPMEIRVSFPVGGLRE